MAVPYDYIFYNPDNIVSYDVKRNLDKNQTTWATVT